MSQESKKPTANDTIVNMIHQINAGKLDLFYQSADKYVETLSTSGDIYYKIKGALRSKPMMMIRLDQMSNDIKGLLRVSDSIDDMVFLNEQISGLISELNVEWSNAEAYRYHNIPVRNKVLFHGPTGNGKTTIARHISKVRGMPLVEVNSDMVVDSHLGKTGVNIHRIFDQLKTPCVLFWDEVDTIGKKRGVAANSADHENDRMVNSVLVNLERMHPDIVFVAATNRMDILDSAFVRRFDVIYEVPRPTDSEMISFCDKLTEYYRLPKDFTVPDLSKAFSFSDLKREFLNSARKYLNSKLKQ